MAAEREQNPTHTRAQAIQILEDFENEGDIEPHDKKDYTSMSNEELGEELSVALVSSTKIVVG